MRRLPRDDSGVAINDRGTELYTVRVADIDTAGVDIQLPLDAKEVQIHVEGSSVVAKLTGTATGSEEINWTSDGYSRNWPICKEAGSTFITIAAPSSTINVSITAWR